VENRDNLELENEQDEAPDSQYGDVPSMSSEHSRIDTTQIKPTGTGCRTCIIFILIIGAVLGFLYLYRNQPENQTPPADTPSGQTRP